MMWVLIRSALVSITVWFHGEIRKISVFFFFVFFFWWNKVLCLIMTPRSPNQDCKLYITVKIMWQCSAPASPIWRGEPPLLPSMAVPLPFLSCLLSYFNFRHKTLHFGENFMKIGPKLRKLSVFQGQFYIYSIFEVLIVEWDYIL